MYALTGRHLSFALPLVATLVLGACAGSSTREGFENPPAPAPTDTTPPTPTGDFTNNPPPAPPPAEVSEVFGHSATTLFRLDPKTKAVTKVGDFSGCKPVIDIALDEASTLVAASYDSLYTVDRTTAKCTEIGTGSYPNSLSFVPKGTVDAGEEALVGYDGDEYVRIDVKTGAKTVLGTLGQTGIVSSGDIVSVKGGATYLTVKGGKDCSTTDCLVEVDPKNGKILKNWKSIEHKNVFGLSFWGGKLYGFDESGELFEVAFGTAQVATTSIPIPAKPAGLSFWGAGSSTAAPLVSTTN